MIEREERRAAALQAAVAMLGAMLPNHHSTVTDVAFARRAISVAEAFEGYIDGSITTDLVFRGEVIGMQIEP